ncbi:MAG: 23S rRNA (adenine(2503)-C(2))-methyltransferase RlmN [Lachnospiraceae bacterium]|nr:23S rRNA (adenine(2503)-C(2))-methyltransferase RlmN [Lachnospiraceae bacterium]
MMVKDIYDLTKTELRQELEELGEKPYRAGQIFSWLHARGAVSFDDMSDISKSLRMKLKERYSMNRLQVMEAQRSSTDGTVKYLFGLHDGSAIEGVFMEYRSWNTACISSQVGCAMGCRFCASGIDGCERNMTAGEMAAEVYGMERDTGKKISNVVIMGSGEPLLNYDSLIRFIVMITDPDGKGISQRNITVSTCGIVPGIDRLAGEKLGREHSQVNLAISLHAATDIKRKKIMPIAEKYSVSEVVAAAQRYYEATHRKVTFEYALIAGQNDTDEDAAELAALLGGKDIHMPVLVNLIPVNPVEGNGYRRPSRQACVNFKNKLENFGINGSIRRELGSDIDGACGQLRRRKRADYSDTGP